MKTENTRQCRLCQYRFHCAFIHLELTRKSQCSFTIQFEVNFPKGNVYRLLHVDILRSIVPSRTFVLFSKLRSGSSLICEHFLTHSIQIPEIPLLVKILIVHATQGFKKSCLLHYRALTDAWNEDPPFPGDGDELIQSSLHMFPARQ